MYEYNGCVIDPLASLYSSTDDSNIIRAFVGRDEVSTRIISLFLSNNNIRQGGNLFEAQAVQCETLDEFRCLQALAAGLLQFRQPQGAAAARHDNAMLGVRRQHLAR